jgi:cobaltochelatase CobN
VPEQGWIDGLKPLLAAYYPGADVRVANCQAAALPLARYDSTGHLAEGRARAHERALGRA